MRLTEMVSTHDARIRWGILSTGHIASVLTRDLGLLPDEAEVVAVGSRSLDKAEQFAREHQIPRAYGSYAELAADPEVDVIYVASTHNDHLGSARLCLEAGKAVLVEKPLTVSAAETEELVRVDAMRELGFHVWFDDFGSGWSALSDLSRFTVDGVKIDRSYADQLGTKTGEVVIGALVSAAAELGLSVTIEGIETPVQYERARNLGCHFGQGYLWSRLVPPAAVARFL